MLFSCDFRLIMVWKFDGFRKTVFCLVSVHCLSVIMFDHLILQVSDHLKQLEMNLRSYTLKLLFLSDFKNTVISLVTIFQPGSRLLYVSVNFDFLVIFYAEKSITQRLFWHIQCNVL